VSERPEQFRIQCFRWRPKNDLILYSVFGRLGTVAPGRTFMKAMRQIVAVLALVMLAGSAQAGLSLTPDGVSRGFTLTTIASNFPNAAIPFSSSGPFRNVCKN
jgi:hypothetical protein